MADLWRVEIDGTQYVVQRYRVIGVDAPSYEAWERTGRRDGWSHSTIATIEGDWYGSVRTLRPSAEIAALPGYTRERYEAVMAHYAARKALAERLIAEARAAGF